MLNRILTAVAACLGLLMVNTDEKPAKPISNQTRTEAVSEVPPPPVATPWLQNIHTIKSGTGTGTAVSIAPDTLYTAHHVTDDGNGWAHVAVDSKWVLATVQPIANAGPLRDGSIIKISGGNLPSVATREPEYREPVTLFGMKSKTKQRGLIVGADTVSLDSAEPGVDFGDSGGGIFADDGCLIGIIRAFDSESPPIGAESNRRVVHFVPAVIFPKDTVASAPKPAPAQPAAPQQNCPNGVCINPQMQYRQPFQFFQRRR